jgi:glucokinase
LDDMVHLVADIGGTNARFAIVPEGEIALRHVATLSAADFPSIEEAIQRYLSTVPEQPVNACFAVACPPDEEVIRFTNSPWFFSPPDLSRRFGWRNLRMVNDFEALALGIAYLSPDQLIEIKGGRALAHAPRAVIGPGTGLGVSGMVYRQGEWAVMAGEGGHIGFAPQDETEIEIWRFARKRFGRVSNERLLQGEGIVTLYQFFCEQTNMVAHLKSAAEISASDEPQALQAIQRFAAILGSVAGDLALMTGARGGVFLGGGIVPKILPKIRNSALVQRFCDKGRLSRMLGDIPIHVITDHHTALYGGAYLLKRDL